MPRVQESRYNPQTGKYEATFTGAEKTDSDIAAAESAGKFGTTAGKGLGMLEKKAKGPMPKMSDYGGDLKAYGEAMRRWRSGDSGENEAQRRALSKMK